VLAATKTGAARAATFDCGMANDAGAAAIACAGHGAKPAKLKLATANGKTSVESPKATLFGAVIYGR
jgi:hypothetical protein